MNDGCRIDRDIVKKIVKIVEEQNNARFVHEKLQPRP